MSLSIDSLPPGPNSPCCPRAPPIPRLLPEDPPAPPPILLLAPDEAVVGGPARDDLRVADDQEAGLLQPAHDLAEVQDLDVLDVGLVLVREVGDDGGAAPEDAAWLGQRPHRVLQVLQQVA